MIYFIERTLVRYYDRKITKRELGRWLSGPSTFCANMDLGGTTDTHVKIWTWAHKPITQCSRSREKSVIRVFCLLFKLPFHRESLPQENKTESDSARHLTLSDLLHTYVHIYYTHTHIAWKSCPIYCCESLSYTFIYNINIIYNIAIYYNIYNIFRVYM